MHRPGIFREFIELMHWLLRWNSGPELAEVSRARRFGNHKNNITIDYFSMCCAASERLDFNCFVTLFHTDRGLSILEHFFMPDELRQIEDCNASGAPFGRAVGLGHENPTFNLRTRQHLLLHMLQENLDISRSNSRSRLVSSAASVDEASDANTAQPSELRLAGCENAEDGRSRHYLSGAGLTSSVCRGDSQAGDVDESDDFICQVSSNAIAEDSNQDRQDRDHPHHVPCDLIE